mgnify:CR=1 FL=1
MDIKELQEMNIRELVEVARGMNIEALSTLRKSELIFKILEGQTEKNGLIYAEGVLQVLAEGFSAMGVPVFLADVKGDLSGLAAAGYSGGAMSTMSPPENRESRRSSRPSISDGGRSLARMTCRPVAESPSSVGVE